MTHGADVAIVGAGLAGLVAARALEDAGATVALVEETARPGGRLATAAVAGRLADLGAQFFTVREPAFAGLVARWAEEGCPIEVWCRGFVQAETVDDGPAGAQPRDDGHARHRVAGGMDRLAAHLAERVGGTLALASPVVQVRPRGGNLHVVTATGPGVVAPQVLLTPPGPQSLALLDVDSPLPAELRRALDGVPWAPCVALVVAVDGPTAVPPPGGVQFARGPVAWLADNARKGLGATVTVHAEGEWSAAALARPDAALAEELLERARTWLDDARVVAHRVHRWRYATPLEPLPERAVAAALGPARLVLAGDAFAGPRVEGAACSGLAAADLLR